MSPATQLADTVRAEMARRRIPQVDLAQRLGLSQTAISRRITGQTEFSVSELQVVADLLGVTASYLLGETAAA